MTTVENVESVTVENGDLVTINYKAMFLDTGEVFDSSENHEEDFMFVVGQNAVIKGFEDAVLGMQVGTTGTVDVEPEDAYGNYFEERIHVVDRNSFPEDFEFTPGVLIHARDAQGNDIYAKALEDLGEEGFKLDFNHPLAGKALKFEVEVVDVTKNFQQLHENMQNVTEEDVKAAMENVMSNFQKEQTLTENTD